MKKRKPTARMIRAIAIALLSWVCITSTALAGDPITLDGVFTDWEGQMHLSDAYDGGHKGDIAAFWWANGDGEPYIYFRVDRHTTDGQPLHGPPNPNGHSSDVTYIVHIDTNNDGVFTDNVDRETVVFYDPTGKGSKVDVTVRYADSDAIISQVLDQDWGSSNKHAEGGLSVEFHASLTDLGVAVNQTIRMYVESHRHHSGPHGQDDHEDEEDEDDGHDEDEDDEHDDDSEHGDDDDDHEGDEDDEHDDDEDEDSHPHDDTTDRVPDAGDIQWTAANIMGYPLLMTLMVAGVVLIWRLRGRYAWTRS